ncbi:hypothetical protein FOL47_003454 [Perkinsus chesapeaki]|uniref:subtilisin n=1 Tax=Perkinsus chesapeaki TaxID=330153 RepID=A0A7J6M801_PERCH|nr:hypothetical protein FOL47_003454 [Perkinsus chesapeaki]
MLRFLLLTYFSFGNAQQIGDRKTLLSIKYGESVISVRDLPRLLQSEISFSTSPRILDFLKMATVDNLPSISFEIVHTSSASVSSGELCAYVGHAVTVLPGLQVKCNSDSPIQAINDGPARRLRELKELDPELHVNDPDTKHQNHLKRMRMGEVWRLLEKYYVLDVRVVVIDSGIDFSDRDLAPVRQIYYEPGRKRNGAWNFANDTEALMIRNRHATRVARVLAAEGNNSYGMVGASRNSRLISFEILYGGDVLKALQKAIDIDAEIVLMPIRIPTGGEVIPVLNEALKAVKEKGIFIISAAGNDGVDAKDTMPCAHGMQYGICVGALSNDDDYTLADLSNHGDSVDIAAFGEDVYVGRNERRSGILVGMGVDGDMIKPLLMRYARPLSRNGNQIRHGSGALDVLATIQGYLREIGFIQ